MSSRIDNESLPRLLHVPNSSGTVKRFLREVKSIDLAQRCPIVWHCTLDCTGFGMAVQTVAEDSIRKGRSEGGLKKNSYLSELESTSSFVVMSSADRPRGSVRARWILYGCEKKRAREDGMGAVRACPRT